jgi:hypothetical protein
MNRAVPYAHTCIFAVQSTCCVHEGLRYPMMYLLDTPGCANMCTKTYISTCMYAPPNILSCTLGSALIIKQMSLHIFKTYFMDMHDREL